MTHYIKTKISIKVEPVDLISSRRNEMLNCSQSDLNSSLSFPYLDN